jgi:hypothetical protein
MNPNASPKIRELTAPEYILENFEPSDRIAILVRGSKRGETIQRITTAANAASPDFQSWLRHKNLVSDVYMGMNTLKHDAQCRTKQDIDKILHLYLDIDWRGPEAIDAIRNSSAVPGPNYVLETSPEKFQVVWKVENVSQSRPRASNGRWYESLAVIQQPQIRLAFCACRHSLTENIVRSTR